MILSAVLNLILPLIENLPTIDITPITSNLSAFWDILDTIGYIFPLSRLYPIIVISISITVIRFVISLIKNIWALLPVV